MSAEVQILAQPHLLRSDVYQAVAPQGLSVAEILGPGAHDGLHVMIGDVPIPRELWHRVRPRAGTQVVVKAIPQDGGGAKDVLRIVATIAVVVGAALLAPYGAALLTGGFGASAATTALVQAGLTLAGTLLVNALIPPQAPETRSNTGIERLPSLSGSRNRARPYEPLPKLYGEFRFTPPLAARPFTEIQGSDQYLRMLLCLNVGPLEIGGVEVGPGRAKLTHQTALAGDPIRIGETDIAAFEEVEYEIGTPDQITLYPATVIEQGLAVAMDFSGPVQGEFVSAGTYNDNVSAIRTTDTGATEISLDLSAAAFIRFSDPKGKPRNVSVVIRIEYRLTGTSPWTQLTETTLTAASQETWRKGWRWSVTEGQYDVRVTRVRTIVGADSSSVLTNMVWSTLRTIRTFQDPFNEPNAVVMALRVRATDQLQGSLDTLNVLGQAVLPVWGGASWTEQATSSPAWAYVDALRGPHLAHPLPDSRLDLDEMIAWAAETAANGLEYHWYHEGNETAFARARAIASTGRAAWSISDGVYTVVRDTAQAEPVQLISPRNSRAFTAEKQFRDLPHAVRVEYIDEATWEVAERTVYADGYDETNATLFERLPTKGIKISDQAWKFGRYHLAAAELRPETYHVTMDFEHLVAKRGSLVKLAYDVMLVGIAWGRIKSVTTDGNGDVTDVTLDEAATMESGQTYVLRVRLADNTQVQQQVNTTPGIVNQLTFTAPVTGIAPGDLWVFGESGRETIDAKVTRIEARNDLEARITLVDAAPEILQADQGAIPPFDPVITGPIDVTQLKPSPPTVLDVRSDSSTLIRDTDGSFRASMLVRYDTAASGSLPLESAQIRFRVQGNDGTWLKRTEAIDDGVIIVERVSGETTVEYQLRVSTIYGVWSDWTAIATADIVGKEEPPPDVDNFLVQRQPDGTRQFSWELSNPPLDLAGYIIKFRFGTGHSWNELSELHDGLLLSSPWETNLLAAGTYTVGIKAVDTSGNESLNATIVESTLGDPRISGSLLSNNIHANGFPGTITNGFVDPGSGDLLPTSQTTWDTVPATWDEWTAWNDSPSTPLEYESGAFDLGFVADFTPFVTFSIASGTVTIEESHSDDDITYTAWENITGVISARFIKIRVSVANPAATGITALTVSLGGNAIVEELTDIDTSTLGSPVGDFRLPIQQSYSHITSVQLALQNVSSGWSWTLIDKDATNGPRINIFDGSGNPADATIDAVVRGI